MKTGIATVDITPSVGSDLCGYLVRVQPSIGLHDNLYAKALYLEDNDTCLLWIHCDLIALEYEFVQKIKNKLSENLKISPDRIVISATHTHAGPATMKLINCGDYDTEYLNQLSNWMLEVAKKAIKKTEDTELVFANGHCDLAIDRRGKKISHTDRNVGILAWKRKDGTYLAVLSNYAMHNVALSGENRLISADMAGYAAKFTTERLPGSPTSFITNGGCGNINPPALGTDFKPVENFGKKLSDSIIAALDNAVSLKQDCPKITREIINIPLDVLDEARIKAAAEGVSDFATNSEYTKERSRQAGQIWQKNMFKKLKKNSLPKSSPVDLQVISIGSVTLVCLGAEVFSIMAEDLRKQTSRNVYIVGYSNGIIGYLPPANVYVEGGYEIEYAFVFYDSFRPKKGAFEMVRDKVIELINKQK